MDKTVLFIACLATAACLSCSRSEESSPRIPPALPESMRGVWHQQDPPGEMRLRLNQVNGVPAVYLCIDDSGTEPPEDSWFGPLELNPTQDGQWRFQVAPVVREDGLNVTRAHPPEVTLNRRYIRDQYGRILLHSCETFQNDGPVTIRPEPEMLRLHGLWIQIEFSAWDNDGKPIEFKTTPKLTRFTRGSPPVRAPQFPHQ